MTTSRILTIVLCSLAVSGCSQAANPSPFVPSGTQAVLSSGEASTFDLLHSFANKPDGALAIGSLINVDGTLYGATACGGVYEKPVCKKAGNGPGGTVYSLDSSGKVTIVHSFGGAKDGANSNATLLYSKGTLYGTTFSGGTYAKGVVFSMKPDGSAYRILHEFGSGTDGAVPGYSLVEVGGNLFGTTSQGGSNGVGTVFRVGADGTNYATLHSFGASGDGSTPLAGLLYLGGRFYGTTVLGGTTSFAGGIAFSITAKGQERVLHEFGNGNDGSSPSGNGLIAVGNTMYGATDTGGTALAGTIFRMTTGGAVTIIHNMDGKKTDPNGGFSSLIYSGGTLYATSRHGGTYDDGTVFTVDPKSGNVNVVHSFGADHSYANGFFPIAAPVAVAGKLYGATMFGGTVGGKYGNGTLYSLKP
jgi:uncharacterized repeat protein (TIGR03803 family)